MRRLVVAALMTVGATGESQPAEKPQADVQVTVQPDGRASLEFTLTLKSPRTLAIPLDSLPWGTYPNLQIVAARADSIGTVLPKAAQFKEPVESPLTTIVADQPVRGRVQLAQHVEALGKALRQSDVVIFWSYRLDVSSELSSNRTGGWLVLRKAD
jgi:hypothetical protein